MDYKTIESPIISEIENIKSIPDDVKNKTYEILNKLKNIPRRTKKRKQIIFFIIYFSYNELGYSVHAQELGKLFGLTRGDISQSNGLFYSLNTNLKLVCKEQTAENYLINFCKKSNFNEKFQEEILTFYKKIIEKSPDLKEESPLILASGIFKYYLIIRGIEHNNDDHFIEITSVSKATTDIYYKKISSIDNQ